MCTLSLFKSDDGYRVFMNRDERHDRLPERSPEFLCKVHNVFGPVDPQSGGTWIAYNAKGYWGCLLNGYFEEQDMSAPPVKSRGEILINILSGDDPFQSAGDIAVSNYATFRLVVGNAERHELWVWNGQVFEPQEFCDEIDERVFFLSSSSFKQDEVIEARRQIFRDWIGNAEPYKNGIPAFHFSQEPSADYAPFMYRSYSRTQSITAMDISRAGAEMDYHRVDLNDLRGNIAAE